MTIKLLTPRGIIPINAIITLDAATEAALVLDKVATTNLSGGVPWSAPVAKIDPLPVTTADLAAALVFADQGIPFIAKDLTLPSIGTNAAASVVAGVAYVNGRRVTYPGGAPGFSNGDNYCDLTDQGALIVTTVAQAAAAPAVPANALRLGFVRCAAGSVNSQFTAIKDSLGTWMGNRTSRPSCILHAAPNAAFSNGTLPYAFSTVAGTTQVLDNCGMHSLLTNNTRITALRPGMYLVSGCLQWSTGTIQEMRLFKNGSVALGVPETFYGANTTGLFALLAGSVYLEAGEYIELMVTATAAPYLFNAMFSAVNVG